MAQRPRTFTSIHRYLARAEVNQTFLLRFTTSLQSSNLRITSQSHSTTLSIRCRDKSFHHLHGAYAPPCLFVNVLEPFLISLLFSLFSGPRPYEALQAEAYWL